VQEAVDGAVGDLGGERPLLIDAAGHDEHQIRELPAQALSERRDGGHEGRAIEHRDARLVCHQQRGQIDLGTYTGHLVRWVGHLLERREQVRIAGECNEGFWAAAEGKAKGALSPRRGCRRVMR
jgi:hypothetical protein